MAIRDSAEEWISGIGLHILRYRNDHNFIILHGIGIPMLLPTIYKSSTIELPTRDSDILSDPAYTVENYRYVGGTKIGFFVNKW